MLDVVVKEFSHLLQGNFFRVCLTEAGRADGERKNDVGWYVLVGRSHLSVLVGHMANVDFTVLVAFVAESALPP